MTIKEFEEITINHQVSCGRLVGRIVGVDFVDRDITAKFIDIANGHEIIMGTYKVSYAMCVRLEPK